MSWQAVVIIAILVFGVLPFVAIGAFFFWGRRQFKNFDKNWYDSKKKNWP